MRINSSWNALSARLVAVVFSLAVVACTQTKEFTAASTFQPGTGRSVILLMEPDVELYELSAGGLLEPNAEWTARAQTNLNQAIADRIARANASVFPYTETEDLPVEDPHIQLVKLHNAVAASILLHKYNPFFALPSEGDRFDYTLGPNARLLKDEFGADYALFVFLRDSFSSAGRKAFVVVGAIFGVGVPTGQQIGFASLVDLSSGDIIWFNRLAASVGDLRTAEGSRAAIDNLLDTFPL